jgi:hypothetical protein
MAAQPAQQSLNHCLWFYSLRNRGFPLWRSPAAVLRHHALFALEMPLIQSVLGSNVNSNNSSFIGELTTKAERLISLRRTTVMPSATRDRGVTELLSIPFLLAYKDGPALHRLRAKDRGDAESRQSRAMSVLEKAQHESMYSSGTSAPRLPVAEERLRR